MLTRCGLGQVGRQIKALCDHLKVTVSPNGLLSESV